MLHRWFALTLVLLVGFLVAREPAAAHPHVWITFTAEIVYAPDGAAIGVRHVWTFDDAYSTFATQDMDPKVKGQFSREELAPLAEVNMTSLKDYDFFTYVKANGQKVAFGPPKDYWLEYADSVLTLHYMLPFAQPVRTPQLGVEIYDPEFFIDFSLAEKNPVTLVGAPSQCKLTVTKPGEENPVGVQRLPDALAGQPDTMNYGAQFANRMLVECPGIVASVVETAQAQPEQLQQTQAPSVVPPRAQSPGPPVGGFVGWILVKQGEFYRQISALMRAAKADGSAVWALLGLSFLYGIFHAAGPGHGKAMISSYLVANEETWRRGVVLSFASALLQAVVAVALVSAAVLLFKASTKSMCDAERVIEIVSYGLIALVGARLLWVKGRAFSSALHALERPLRAVGAAVTPPHKHDHGHHDHHHDHHHHQHAHVHSHGHHDHDDDASAWGHAHGPEPEELAGPGGWKRGLSAIVAVGLRPCSGAILVLVFALAQGLYWVGVASTFVMGLGTAITVAAIATVAVSAKSFARHFAKSRAGYGMLLLRGIEVGAAVVVTVFGTLLLFGYMIAERGACL
jgi:ABC-type nickel/cobalt efflux system permease component RcnA/ABC-type uncharacterized transport system substrate-binding protein